MCLHYLDVNITCKRAHMHVDARNDEDLRHSASAWASGNPLSTTILGGIDETHRTVVKTNATDVHMLHVKKGSHSYAL